MSGSREPTYLEQVAQAIWWSTGEKEPWYPHDEAALWLGYAALCIAKRERTTSFDVHQIWSMWATIKHDGHHKSLLPFDHLDATVQRYDDLYRDAIRTVAGMLGRGRVWPKDEIRYEEWAQLAQSRRPTSQEEATEQADE